MNKVNNSCMCYTTKVIPLAFDESMSYYEQICKLTAKMKELISFTNNELIEQLKEYIEKELISFTNNVVTEQVKEYIENEFNNMMLNTMYDAETETLTLYLVRESE